MVEAEKEEPGGESADAADVDHRFVRKKNSPSLVAGSLEPGWFSWNPVYLILSAYDSREP